MSDNNPWLLTPYIRPPEYIMNIPEYNHKPEDVAKQMRVNADCIMKEISDHVDKELDRFKKGIIPDQ